MMPREAGGTVLFNQGQDGRTSPGSVPIASNVRFGVVMLREHSENVHARAELAQASKGHPPRVRIDWSG